jgi:hypothetical protein
MAQKINMLMSIGRRPRRYLRTLTLTSCSIRNQLVPRNKEISPLRRLKALMILQEILKIPIPRIRRKGIKRCFILKQIRLKRCQVVSEVELIVSVVKVVDWVEVFLLVSQDNKIRDNHKKAVSALESVVILVVPLKTMFNQQ